MEIWGGIAFLLGAAALTVGYLAVVAWRWPGDGEATQRRQQQMLARYPQGTAKALVPMMELLTSLSRQDRARPLGYAAAGLAVLAVLAVGAALLA